MQAEELRRIIEGIPGPKRVVLEQGPMSGMIHSALADVADEIISCDPTQNAWIARSEDKNDELDARRLAKLSRVGALREVYVPPDPYARWCDRENPRGSTYVDDEDTDKLRRLACQCHPEVWVGDEKKWVVSEKTRVSSKTRLSVAPGMAR